MSLTREVGGANPLSPLVTFWGTMRAHELTLPSAPKLPEDANGMTEKVREVLALRRLRRLLLGRGKHHKGLADLDESFRSR